MRFERFGARPLLDHDEAVGTEHCLEPAEDVFVDGGTVLDAALLGAHGRYVGVERSRRAVRRPGLEVIIARTWIMTLLHAAREKIRLPRGGRSRQEIQSPSMDFVNSPRNRPNQDAALPSPGSPAGP